MGGGGVYASKWDRFGRYDNDGLGVSTTALHTVGHLGKVSIQLRVILFVL